MLHKIYLPFSEEQLKEHFVSVDEENTNIQKHIDKYRKSIDNYHTYKNKSMTNLNVKVIRQIEKDETFWTASSLMTLFHSNNKLEEFKKMLELAFGEIPPIDRLSSWDDCLKGELRLFFEPNIPSPKGYLNWLKNYVNTRQFIPYILEHSKNKKGDFREDLEGPTNVDAMLLNETNGFSVFIEAKVLSDISYQTTYDSQRNQIIRNIDVMLDGNNKLHKPLNTRDPNKTLFLLLTPKIFKDNPTSRFYGYKMNDYKNSLDSIKNDLLHRNLSNSEIEQISKKLGWITWEDLQNINNNCCPWLDKS